MRLDLPAGTAVSFEPGEAKQVQLVALAGERKVYGGNALVSGSLDESRRRQESLKRMCTAQFGDEASKPVKQKQRPKQKKKK